MSLETQAGGAAEQEFVIARTVDAPRDLVWRAYTEGDRLAKWWGPKGFTMLKSSVDLRPGGIFHYGMSSPAGNEMWGKLVYREIRPIEFLSFVVSFSDPDAGITRHPMSASWPLEVLSTLELEDQDGKTHMTMRSIPVNANEEERATFAQNHESVRQGFEGSLQQLEQYLAEAQQGGAA